MEQIFNSIVILAIMGLFVFSFKSEVNLQPQKIPIYSEAIVNQKFRIYDEFDYTEI